MKLRRLGSLFVLSAAFAVLAAACGDDSGAVVNGGSDDDDTQSEDGTGGGSSSSYSTSTTGGNSSTSSGGNASTGGSTNASGCPDTEPQAFSQCTASTTPGSAPTTCTYDDTDCTCMNQMWLCQDNTQDEDCPANAPQDGSSCQGLDGTSCDYGFQGACSCENGEWSCDTADNCPDAAPTAGSQCFGSEGSSCEYDSGNCTCNTDTTGGSFNSAWECEDGDTTDSTTCPEDVPAAGDACESGGTSCSYGGQTCLCQFGTTGTEWQCAEDDQTAEDCPAEAPESGDDCTADSLCSYSDSTCICAAILESWVCA